MAAMEKKYPADLLEEWDLIESLFQGNVLFKVFKREILNAVITGHIS
jgi:hypothetical protein